MPSKHLPQDEATPKQRSFIVRLLYQVSPRVTAHTPESEWIAELNSLCNLNIEALTDLSRREASDVITKLQDLSQ